MRLRSLVCMLGLVGLAQLGFGGDKARAELLLNFSQTSGSNTITGLKTSDTGFSITGTDVAISITQIDPATALATPISAYLNLTMNSTAAAGTVGGVVDYQNFSGTFTLTSGPGGSGINYLSTTALTVSAVGQSGAYNFVLGSLPGAVAFSSDVFATMPAPQNLSLQLGNVLPGYGLTGNSLSNFSASITGTASAGAVPEPASIVAALIGLTILAPMGRRRLTQQG